MPSCANVSRKTQSERSVRSTCSDLRSPSCSSSILLGGTLHCTRHVDSQLLRLRLQSRAVQKTRMREGAGLDCLPVTALLRCAQSSPSSSLPPRPALRSRQSMAPRAPDQKRVQLRKRDVSQAPKDEEGVRPLMFASRSSETSNTSFSVYKGRVRLVEQLACKKVDVHRTQFGDTTLRETATDARLEFRRSSPCRFRSQLSSSWRQRHQPPTAEKSERTHRSSRSFDIVKMTLGGTEASASKTRLNAASRTFSAVLRRRPS